MAALDNCKLIPNGWNDGDSFHVVSGGVCREIVARLYFVDTPEAETAYRDSLDEQASYLGIIRAHTLPTTPLDELFIFSSVFGK